jgi:hypothetical protein
MGYRRPIVEFGNQTLGRRSLDDLTKEELVSALRSSDRASA